MAEELEQRIMLSVPATPLQSVQTSVDASGVHFSVMDPQKNSLQKGFESLVAGETASTVLNSNGVIAWSKSSLDNFAALHTEVFWEVYDIQKGSWRGGHQELPSGATLGALQNSGGVVSWSATSLDYYSAPNARVFYEVYDPQKGAWRDGDTSLAAGEIVATVQNSGGVVAFSASSRDLYGDLHQRVFFRVYDPQRGVWRNGDKSLATNEATTAVTITNCTVSWTSNTTKYTRGYDPGSGKWTSHASKPLAFFYGGSYIGNPSLTLYLWDMSIGATSWSWSFGDGSTSTSRAPTHTFTTAGVFTLTQTATNAGVSSTQHVTVKTDAVAPTDIALSNGSIAEHMPRGSVVGTLGAVGQGKFTWSLVGGDGSQDNASFRISGSQLCTNAVFDYTTKNSYSIRVRVTQKSGLNSEAVFTINVLNMFDISGTSLSVTPGSLTELGGVISVKRTYQITDRPAGDFFIQYRLSTDTVWDDNDIVLGGDESITERGGKSVGTHTKTLKLNVPHVRINPNGSYFLLANLDAANTVSENNETNNIISTPLQIALPSFGWVNGVHHVMKVSDTDGDVLKFSLSGTGTGTLTGDDLDTLALTGTSASSVLTITVIRSGGGDGRLTLKGITSDRLMKRITGKAVVVDGDVTINTLLVTPAPRDTIAITLANITGVLTSNLLPISSEKLLDKPDASPANL